MTMQLRILCDAASFVSARASTVLTKPDETSANAPCEVSTAGGASIENGLYTHSDEVSSRRNPDHYKFRQHDHLAGLPLKAP